MSASITPESTPFFAPDPLLQDLLAVSLTAINLLRPCYSPTGELNDFAPEYFNPAAQRMTGLPEQPVGTARTLFPDIFQNGIFAFYRQVFETGEPGQFQRYYQGDGLDNYFHIAARRSGERLLVSFTDTADQPRSAAENALRASQATEQQARAAAERERGELAYVVARAPVAMGLLRGPDFIIELANTRMSQIWGRPAEQLLGQPHFEVLPDLAGQGFEQVLQDVLTTGQAHEQWEQPILIAQPEQLYQAYLNITYLPEYDASGQPTGILIYATDVTEQVLARHQVQTLNEELATLNEELRASNEEYQQANAAVTETQQQLETARAEAEAERQRLYQVLMRMPANIALLRGPEHVYDLVNAEYERLFPARTTLGRPIREVIPPIESQGFYEPFDRVYETGKPFYQAEAEVWADYAGTGTPQRRYYRTAFEPIRNAEGEVTEVLSFAVDVTAQVEVRQQVEQFNAELEDRVQERTREVVAARAETERQRAQLANLFQQAPAAICILDGPELVYELVNPSYQQFFPNRPLLGKPLLEALPELRDSSTWDMLQRVYRTGQTHIDESVRIPLARQSAGTLEDIYFNYVFQGRTNPQGQGDGIIVFAYEVTEQVLARQQVQDLNEELAAINEELRATNEELNESNSQLTRSNVDLDTFVYTASHDLKAPITNIESIVLALRDTLPPAVQQDELVAHLLTLLDQTVTRFQFTIGQLTDITRLQLAHTGPAEPVVLAQVVADVRLDLIPLLTAAGTALTIKVPDKLVVSFSPANLRSVVYNLLSNAVKYRAADRPNRVQIQAARGPSGVVLTVQDNGLGMSEVQQRQLFGLFQRLHIHVEGTGVGLYISKRLVENAGGTITVQSQPSVGTTFTVTFPA